MNARLTGSDGSGALPAYGRARMGAIPTTRQNPSGKQSP